MNKKMYWGVFFIALATLIWEILLTRIFSATMYYHFVFMSISLAMLGFGCSGVMVFLLPRYFSKERCLSHLVIFSSLFSITIVLSAISYIQTKANFTTPSLASFLVLFKIFFFILLPYFFSGLTITLALKHFSKKVNVLYCYDLVGAGMGCVFVIGMLFIYDGISLVLLTAFLASCSSLFFAQNSPSRVLKNTCLALCLLMLCVFIYNAYIYRFLKIKYVQGEPQTNIIFEEWNPINRVTVVPRDFSGHEVLEIKYDSTATALMHKFDGDKTQVGFLKEFLASFYYQIRNNAKVLIIGVGGGQDVLNAYINNQKEITGIEINPSIALLNKETYRSFNGNLFSRPGVSLHVGEGRNFVRHSRELYDIIHLPNVDSGVASSSGAFTFVENTLYTVEAFKDYYRHLTSDGVLWVARWRHKQNEYFLEDFRVLSGAVKALEEFNIEHPENHIVMIQERYKPSWRQVIFLMKKTPFLPEEITAIDNLRAKMNLEWVHCPGEKKDNMLDDYLFSKDKQTVLKNYPFRVDPNTDNCPFFFNFLKPLHYIGRLPAIETNFTYPVFMFKSLFVIVFLMVLATIFIPLSLYSFQKDSICFRGGYIIYFICLGLGFMLVEIPLIQKFILFLGQPLYAIAIILSSLLIFSGIGSLLSGKFPQQSVISRLKTSIFALCILLLVYVYGLSSVFDLFLGASALIRFIIAVLLIIPLGLLMGMALPLGIRLLEHDGPSMIPWVWGVNGACSVMGSIIAWGLSLNFGYNFTLCIAIAVYGGACCIMLLKPSRAEQKVLLHNT